ncbi:MAG: response regulator, partial [Campylobacterales bacterium]|nr:response regulator [Campylobacterales bacterium]
MKKIALIEDRDKRQKDFLTQNDINLDQYEDILDNFIHHKADDILEQISHDSFSFESYDIIICHKSVENNTVVLSTLQNYCKKHHKTLVLFSGGISVNYYDNSEYQLLELNSKTFYSQNLKLFLEAVKTGNEDIMMLCYGENWKLNIVSNILEKTNYLLGQIDENKIFYEEFADFLDIEKLSKVEHSFYDIQIQNSRTDIDEIKKFRDSLLEYFTILSNSNTQNNQEKSIVIHYDNVIDTEFNDDIKFNSDGNIDKYISSYIIDELSNKEFDKIFIKDNLSSNYLELYGLRVAYHIRLSSELGSKRFVSIVIISDFNEATLNRFTHEANILFTQGIYLCKNTKEDIQKYQSLELQRVTNYDEFLANIEVSPPKDTSGSHDIANKWAIYRWGEFLKVDSDAVDKNKSEIENELYFKYLNALNKKDTLENIEIQKPTKKGKVLLIDDEWNKGWSDIISQSLDSDKIEFDCFEYDFKDKTKFSLYMQIQNKIKTFDPDVVVLDLRLSQTDHENEDIENYTGIKILQKIHEINAGIQVIMLTATSKSTILEKLYEKKILGYIKKEHPNDSAVDTVENVNKFVGLVDKGLGRKYLKEIWDLQKNILSYDLPKDILIEINTVFEVLDSNMENKFNFTILTFSKVLEYINKLYINEYT